MSNVSAPRRRRSVPSNPATLATWGWATHNTSTPGYLGALVSFVSFALLCFFMLPVWPQQLMTTAVEKRALNAVQLGSCIVAVMPAGSVS